MIVNDVIFLLRMQYIMFCSFKQYCTLEILFYFILFYFIYLSLFFLIKFS